LNGTIVSVYVLRRYDKNVNNYFQIRFYYLLLAYSFNYNLSLDNNNNNNLNI